MDVEVALVSVTGSQMRLADLCEGTSFENPHLCMRVGWKRKIIESKQDPLAFNLATRKVQISFLF